MVNTWYNLYSFLMIVISIDLYSANIKPIESHELMLLTTDRHNSIPAL